MGFYCNRHGDINNPDGKIKIVVADMCLYIGDQQGRDTAEVNSVTLKIFRGTKMNIRLYYHCFGMNEISLYYLHLLSVFLNNSYLYHR